MAGWPESRSKLARWVGLVAATFVALYLCWAMLQPFIEVLLWAVVLVIVFMPVHRRVRARVGSPGWSAMLSCLLVVVVLLVPLTLITLAVVREMTHIAQALQPQAGGGGASQAGVAGLFDPNSPYVGRALNWIGRYVDLEQFNSEQFIAERLKSLGGAIAGRTLGFVGGAVGFVVEIFFVIFTMYYLFRDGERMRQAVYNVMPLDDRRAHEIIDRTQEVISASVYGVLVIAVIQGVL